MNSDLINDLNLLQDYKPSSRKKIRELLESDDLENAYSAYSWDADKRVFYKEYIDLRRKMWQRLRAKLSNLSDSDFINQFGEVLD